MQPFDPAVERLLIPKRLSNGLSTTRGCLSAASFAEQLLKSLDIRYEISESDLARIPRSGSAIVVANHPFGFLEGLILLPVLEKVRNDFRIVANSLLCSVPHMRDRLIFVNPFHDHAAPQGNSRSLRACVECLGSGGLIVMFPAGEVAHLNWGEQPVADPKWNDTAARLARRIGCPTVPFFFAGMNSLGFQLMGTIHPGLRTLSLLRELVKKQNQTIRMRTGSSIPGSVLKGYPTPEAATEYLRARTYLLQSRPGKTPPKFGKAFGVRSRHVENASPARLIHDEVLALGSEHELASTEDLAVYLASAKEIPQTLREIGRQRELTFRQVGEGTRNAIDLDEFDEYYQHLFLWHRGDQRVAGAYRLVATNDVLPNRGIKGLYTSTLFHYDPAFFDRIGPAFELGRSFICPEYQKHYAPLLLLWKGIARCAERRPECAVLFGAVSVSSDYHPISRELIVDFSKGKLATEFTGLVTPRRSYRKQPFAPKYVKKLTELLSSIEELSSSIADVEGDNKGVPVLMRQYLKVGGQFIGFNVDPSFSNALDVLVLADLRKAPAGMLERCMGRDGVMKFRALHKTGL